MGMNGSAIFQCELSSSSCVFFSRRHQEQGNTQELSKMSQICLLICKRIPFGSKGLGRKLSYSEATSEKNSEVHKVKVVLSTHKHEREQKKSKKV